MTKETATDVEVRFMLPKSAVAFIGLLCSLSGQKREEWFREVIREDLKAMLNDPDQNWNEEYLRDRYGLEPFLSEDR
jgi:hypothetical protein